MPYARAILVALLGFSLIVACRRPPAPEGASRTILVGETGLHKRPERLSSKIATLKYGQQVILLPKKSIRIPAEWVEVYLDEARSGFVRKSALAAPETVEALRRLQQSLEGIEPQASGQTIVSTHFRLEPGRDGKPIEKLPAGTRFEMFERLATLRSRAPSLSVDYAPPQKDIWYKVRLGDGRVGYIYTKNFRLEPPAELSRYTQFRRPIAWLVLKTRQSEDFGTVREYLVAYASPGKDFGADFDRVEAYQWDGKQYQTAFFLSSLRGILPIRVIRQENGVYFELTELDPGQKGQVTVQRYSYAYPYKKVESTSLPREVGLH
ncbi:MAG TPA: SH3 domain-containing protein [bacterium]|nr:SH3 domain-containing protein [bacterium]